MAVIAPVVAGVAAAGAASAAGATAFAVSLAYTLASTAVSLALMKKTHSSSDVGKMESLKKMEVKYGAVLPEIYGTIETAGNIIWASDFQEHKKEDTTNVGKGGGSSHTTTTYSYSISFAVAFCIGEITNLQYIKFNDKKVLDLSSSGGGYSNFKTHYEFYKGTEDQLPSSVIESYEGAGNVEAYRNICYIVFENLDLTDFGNQIPNVTVCLSKSIDKNEVKPHFEEFNSILKYSEKESNDTTLIPTNSGLREYNENDKCLYLFNRNISDNKVNIIKYDVFNKKVLRDLNIDDVNTSGYHHKEAFFINNKQNFVLFNKNAESMFIYNTNDFTLQKEIKVKDFDKKLDDSSNFVNNISGFIEIYKTGFIFSQSNLASYFYARSKNGWSPTLYHNEFVLCGISYDLSNTSQNLFKISKNSNVQNYRNRQNSIYFNDTTAGNLQNNNANVINLANIKAISSSGINEYPNYNDCKPTFYKNKTNEIYSFSIQSSSDLNVSNIMDTRFMLTLSKVNLSNMKFEEDSDIIIDSSIDDYNDRDYKNGLSTTRRTDVNYFNYNEKTDEVVFLLNHSFTDLPVNGKIICQRTFSLIKYNLTTKKKEVAQNFFYSDAHYANTLEIYFDKEKNELKGRINGIQKNRYYNNNEGTSNVNKFVKIKLNNFNYEIYDVQNDDIGQKIVNTNITYISDIDTFINITPLNNNTTKETTYRDIRFKPLTFVKGKYPLDKLVKDLCLKNNLNKDDIDVTSLENDEVKGFVVHSENSIRDCIQQLASVYNFDVVESDWKIKFKKADKNNIVKYIDENELNAQEFNDEMNFNENIVINRVHELALPKTLNLNYFDYDKEYEQNTQDCIKYTTKSVDTSNISVNVILTADEAKNIAAVLLESAYTQKDTFQFVLNYDHLDLEPLDVIHISLHNGANYTVKITKIESDKGLIKVQAVKEDSTIYNQNLKGETGLIKETTPQLISQTESVFIDMPIFRDSDDDFGFYIGSKKKNDNFSWSGSVLSKASNLNSNFIEVMSFTSPIKTGYTKNKLENYVDGLTIDSFNELEVYSEQQLESLDDDDFLNGKNLAIVGNEYILFKNAELTANKTYKLTGLLRGMFNTQSEIDKHNQIERFILINNQTAINRVNLDFANTSNFYYKNTTFKNNINDTSIENFINNSKGKMCYNVFDVRSNRDVNNNLNITYKTASRNINYLLDDNVNVDFDKNLFEIVIYNDNTYSTVVNTIQTNNTSVVYTQQQQINDFGTVKNEIFIEIFKLNENNKRNLGYKTSV